MANEKVYTPEVVQDTPFPEQGIQLDTLSQPSAGGNFSPTVSKDKSFPRKRVAREVISTILNTKSKKILGNFKLEQSGGFQIGDYKSGVTGDLRLTPDGQVARNKAGIITFAIDADTGDITLLGTLQAGSVIATDIDGDLIDAGTITADKLSASYIIVGGADADLQSTGINDEVELGAANIVLDGANNRILVTDGVNNRIVIGDV